MILRHIHLPSLTPYTQAAQLQDSIVRAFLACKASASTVASPPPTVITATFSPVYTCGRREIGSITPAQQAFLRQGLGDGDRAEFHEALRGGQTTFHGPGQLVAYPILDLKKHSLTPRCYVHLLEECVIRTCAQFGVKTMRTENPGVWTDDVHKICALGVHLRRNITSHGIGLNVSTNLGWFDRIVACGLEGKRATSLTDRGSSGDLQVEEAGDVFAKIVAERLEGVDGVERVQEWTPS